MMSIGRDEVTKIKRLPVSQQTDYQSFIVSNDKSLMNTNLSKYQFEQDFLLIGTSLFGSITLACKLAKNTAIVPEIVIIDNSLNVSIAWSRIKEFFAKVPSEMDVEEFLHGENGFLDLLLNLIGDKIIRSDDNISRYFMKFFKHYPLSYIKQIVEKIEVIEQDWANANTFSKLKSIYAEMPVVAYSSNIIDYVAPEIQIKVLQNLETLNPCLSFCTNLDKIQRVPTKHFVLEDNNPLVACEALQLSDEVRAHFTGKDDRLNLEEMDIIENDMSSTTRDSLK